MTIIVQSNGVLKWKVSIFICYVCSRWKMENFPEKTEHKLRCLKVLFNKCLDEGRIPKDWQNPELILLLRKEDSNNIQNYRTISLLWDMYKLLTKIIINHLANKLGSFQPVWAGIRKLSMIWSNRSPPDNESIYHCMWYSLTSIQLKYGHSWAHLMMLE